MVAAFSDLVRAQHDFERHELPEIFAAPCDEGENDLCRSMVKLDAELLTAQFVQGKIATFARPLGGGEVVAVEAALWEIDDPLPRLATGAFSLEHWADPDAPSTHRILVDATEFDKWLVQLEPPGALDDAEIEAIVDPRLRAARSLALKAKSAQRQRRRVELMDREDLRQAPSSFDQAGLITMKDVRELTRLGRSTIYRLIDDGSFPQPKRIGRSVRWPRIVIDEWIAAQAEADESGAI